MHNNLHDLLNTIIMNLIIDSRNYELNNISLFIMDATLPHAFNVTNFKSPL